MRLLRLSSGPYRLRLSDVLPLVYFTLIVGAMSVVFAISLAALVYKGDLAPYLSRGIGFTLAGSAIIGAAGALLLSYRGTVCQPQDPTAAVLSLAATSVAASSVGGNGEELFATVATLVLVTTALTGVAAFSLGLLRLGRFGRFIPYPVIGGFLAASGWLLVSGAIEMVTGVPLSLDSAHALISAGLVMRWAPWFIVAAMILAAYRQVRSAAVLPLGVIAAAAGFYGFLWATGTSLIEAQEQGFLLGPFDQAGFAAGIAPTLPAAANWRLISEQWPSLLLVMGLASLGAIVNAAGIEIATNEDIDLDRDLRGLGIANLVSSLGGGMVGYHILGRTLLARRLSVSGRAAGIIVSLSCLLGLFYGGPSLSLFPVGLIASVLIYLGLDLIVAALWDNGRKLPWPEFFVVLISFGAGVTFGFLEAIVAGLLAATLLFVVTYSRLDLVRLRTDARRMRSRVERGPEEQVILAHYGHLTRIYELDGYVFFGTAYRLIAEIRDQMNAAEPPTTIIIDFKRVRGLDASAAKSITRLVRLCENQGVEPILSGLPQASADLLRHLNDDSSSTLPVVETLHQALEMTESRLLVETQSSADRGGVLQTLLEQQQVMGYAGIFETVDVGAGEELIAQSGASDALYVLLEGTAQAEVVDQSGRRVVVAGFRPGALIGEIGLYAKIPRTTRIVSPQGCKTLRIGADVLDQLHHENASLAADIHRLVAESLARRLARTTELLRDSDL